MEKSHSKSAAKCSQCDTPAVVNFGGNNLCVDHYLKIQQANYLQSSMLAAMQNLMADQADAGAGYIIRHSRIQLPRPPFIGDSLTLTNINVSRSTIGAINTGTIKNLDASISIMHSQGKSELAMAIKELTEAIMESNKINEKVKNEIAEQLEFLTVQATAEPKDRSSGVIKSVLLGLRDSISTVAGLIAIWDKVEPLLRTCFGM